ncbi:hypothetical protein X801_10137, partial [Opisthorchis viverrini]
MMQVANKANRLHANRVLFCRSHPAKPGETSERNFAELFFETENLDEEMLICPGKLALTLQRVFNSPPGGNISMSKVAFTSVVGGKYYRQKAVEIKHIGRIMICVIFAQALLIWLSFR